MAASHDTSTICDTQQEPYKSLMRYATSQDENLSEEFYTAFIGLLCILNNANTSQTSAITILRDKLAHDCLAVTPRDLKACINVISGRDLLAIPAGLIEGTQLYKALFPKKHEAQQERKLWFQKLNIIQTHARSLYRSKSAKNQTEILQYWYAKNLVKVYSVIQSSSALTQGNIHTALRTIVCIGMAAEIGEQLAQNSFNQRIGFFQTSQQVFNVIRNNIFHARNIDEINRHCVANVLIFEETRQAITKCWQPVATYCGSLNDKPGFDDAAISQLFIAIPEKRTGVSARPGGAASSLSPYPLQPSFNPNPGSNSQVAYSASSSAQPNPSPLLQPQVIPSSNPYAARLAPGLSGTGQYPSPQQWHALMLQTGAASSYPGPSWPHPQPHLWQQQAQFASMTPPMPPGHYPQQPQSAASTFSPMPPGPYYPQPPAVPGFTYGAHPSPYGQPSQHGQQSSSAAAAFSQPQPAPYQPPYPPALQHPAQQPQLGLPGFPPGLQQGLQNPRTPHSAPPSPPEAPPPPLSQAQQQLSAHSGQLIQVVVRTTTLPIDNAESSLEQHVPASSQALPQHLEFGSLPTFSERHKKLFTPESPTRIADQLIPQTESHQLSSPIDSIATPAGPQSTPPAVATPEQDVQVCNNEDTSPPPPSPRARP